MAEHREHLKELVDERTAELAHANAQLIKEIDDRKRAEEEVRRTAERFQSLIENGHDMITVLDAGGKILYESPSIERLLGYNDAELAGMNIYEFIHPDDQVAAGEALARVAGKPGKTDNLEVRLKHKNGGWRLLDAAGKSYVDDLGVVNVIVNSRDVTERRHMEDSLHRMQKLESLGVFAGGLAHDLNNVLMGVMANIDLALMDMAPEDSAHQRLEQAMKAADRAGNLTNQLITFSKGGEPAKRVISIGNLIKNSSDLALSGTNVSCEVTVPERLWPVEADEGQIAQVINNILINAVQAMPQGGVVRIGCENIPAVSEDPSDIQEKRYVKITIKDQGNGIPAEHLDKIFDPYFTTKKSGSGLGLAVAYSIVKRHEGRITVESESGVGSAFHIYLPATDKAAEIKDAGEQKITRGSGKILLMDDEETVRDVAGAVLRTLGYEVTFAREGMEALDLYRQATDSGNPFDVVILDLTVPGRMGGKDAVKRLLEMDPRAKVIVSSGYSDDPIMAHFREYGFAAAVPKPYKVREIGETLKKVLSI